MASLVTFQPGQKGHAAAQADAMTEVQGETKSDPGNLRNDRRPSTKNAHSESLHTHEHGIVALHCTKAQIAIAQANAQNVCGE